MPRHIILAKQEQYLRRSPDKSLCDLQHAHVFCQFKQVFPQLFFVFSHFPQFCLQFLQLFLRHGQKTTQNQCHCFGNWGRINFKHMLICLNDGCLSSIGFTPQSAKDRFVLSTVNLPLAPVKSSVLLLICV